MGLDSFLKATKFISGYSFQNKEVIDEYNKLLNIFGLKDSDVSNSTPSGEVRLTVAYWRKANQIHNWFVTHAQDGKDECQPSSVSREQLQILIDTCKEVLKDKNRKKKLGEDLLPTTSGFFFGSTGYDEYYYEDLQNTVDQLEKILNNPIFNDWGFEYQASW